MSHTPGPWRVYPAAKSIHPWVVATERGDSVADASPCGPWVSNETADANARLIAAAPDLLHVAQAIASHLQRGAPAGEGKHLRLQLQAAIHKATGKP